MSQKISQVVEVVEYGQGLLKYTPPGMGRLKIFVQARFASYTTGQLQYPHLSLMIVQ